MLALTRSVQLVREIAVEFARPGEADVSGREMWLIGRFGLTVVIVATNLVGAGAVLAVALFVIPMPAVANAGHLKLLNGLIAAGYLACAVLAGALIGTRGLKGLREWLVQEREASFEEIRLVLRAPMLLFAVQVGLWLIAAALFGVFNAVHSWRLGLQVTIIVAATGLVTAACSYLLSEVLLRPAAARALAGGVPRRLVVPGVATRSVLAWVLGTAIPLIGLVAVGLLALTQDPSLTSRPRAGVHQLGVSMTVLGGAGLAVGLLAVVIVARTTADPIDSVRRALARVQRGELDLGVPVYDGTQIGQLQLGFNEMVKGLRERERIREAFGTYVDPEVAARVLEEGTSLAGEEVEVTIMFIDIKNFTGFAQETSADRVVSAINYLFERFVPVIHEHGGWVDKFVGDGLLAVFGAPRRLPDHADKALAAALQIKDVESPDALRFGIGLNSGQVVAGNVGGAGRLEFSVIGDPVNVAARVEAATRATGDPILLTQRTRELLSDEHPELTERPDVKLKGKSGELSLFAPRV